MKKWKVIQDKSDKDSNISCDKSSRDHSHHIKSKGYIPLRRKSEVGPRPNIVRNATSINLHIPGLNQTFINGRNASNASEGQRRLKTQILQSFPSQDIQGLCIQKNSGQLTERDMPSKRFSRKSFDQNRIKTDRQPVVLNKPDRPFEKKAPLPDMTDVRTKLRKLQRQQQKLKKNTDEELKRFHNAILQTQKGIQQSPICHQTQYTGLPQDEVDEIMEDYQNFKSKMSEMDEQKQFFIKKLMKN